MKKNEILVIILLLVLGIGGYLFYDRVINPTSKKLRDRFSENLFLLQHDYAYKVTAETANGPTSIYLVKREGNVYDVWEPGNTGNRVYATALMMDSNGLCVTSRYAAEPWKNEIDISSIKKLIVTQTGINETDIEVTGRTIRMVIKPVSMIGTGNTTEIECVRYTSKDQPEETAFIGKPENGRVLPIKKLDLGSNYPQYREKERSLYVLTVPAYDYSVSLPMKAEITKVKAQGDDDYGTFFSDPAMEILEGSPVFDSKLSLVGVYTSVSRSGKSYYVSHYNRSFDAPSILSPAVVASLVGKIDSIPQFPSEIKIPELVEPQFAHFDFPFVTEEGWSILEEKSSEKDGTQATSEPSMINFTTSPFTFNQQKARFRIKIEGDGAVDVGLMTDKNGFIQVDYSDKLRSGKTVDLGILEGTYTMSVLHDINTKVRFAFERLE
jgi:hypothetical protein